MTAFLLIHQKLDGSYASSRYGYASPQAATRAAPTLNSVRTARLQIPYTSIAELHDGRVIRLVPLEHAS